MPLDEGDWNPLPDELFGDPPVDVGPLYVPTEDFVVLSAYQTERFMGSGRRIPQIAATFAIPGLPGTFTIRLDNNLFSSGEALTRVERRSLQIKEIYDL